METIQNITTIPNSSTKSAGGRLSLSIAGILTAIICLFTLLSEVRSSAYVPKVYHTIEVPKIVTGDFSASSVRLVSALWPF